jgi:hypothetical protein
MTNSADDIPQSERSRIMAEERRLRTYHGHAQANLDEDRGGRFAFSGSPKTVIGSSPIQYPAQPAHSPWAKDACPPEPPLGFSVDEMEPFGEPHERTASATSSSAQAGDDVRPVRRRGIRRI